MILTYQNINFIGSNIQITQDIQDIQVIQDIHDIQDVSREDQTIKHHTQFKLFCKKYKLDILYKNIQINEPLYNILFTISIWVS